MAPNRNLSNILQSTAENKLIPHHNEFQKFFNQESILLALSDYKFWICGGWPLAVLAAPRYKNRKYIHPDYYSDFDIYSDSEAELDKISNKLSSMHPESVHTTDNARSFHFPSGCNIQVIYRKEGIASAPEVIAGFDFVNCAIAYEPSTDIVHFHKDLIHAHVNSELQILEPWMLNDICEDKIDYVITQLTRFYKYCDRWEYNLSKDSLDILVDIYNKHPNIALQKDKAYAVGSGDMKNRPKHDQNVWVALSDLIVENQYWNDSMDKHGLLTSADSNEELAIEVDEWLEYKAVLEPTKEETKEKDIEQHALW